MGEAKFWSEKLKGRDQSGDLGVAGRNRVQLQVNVNMVMNLQVP
jgi:hypothetical protein